jgi:putative transposase
MKFIRAFKTELDLNNNQRTACIKHAGAARWAYNWGLARKQAAYEAGLKAPDAIELHRELNALKHTEISWMYEVSKTSPQEALRNLDNAFSHFFRRVRLKRQGKLKGKVGFPKFKSKKTGIGNFQVRGSIHIHEKSIQLPRLGVLRLKERNYFPVEGVRILNATVSEKAGRWFASIQCEVEIPDPTSYGKPVCGVDLGIANMATVSDGKIFENPKALRSNLEKIIQLQRIVSRRIKGSANRRKAVQKLATVHLRVANIRKDSIHKVTSQLTKTKSIIVLENLNVSGMIRNHHLAQAISDVSFSEFKRQIIYKSQWYGCEVILADRFFPSSKICHVCKYKLDELSLKIREWDCSSCGTHHDRDLNAAYNLQSLATTTASSVGSYVCGEDIRPEVIQADFDEAETELYIASENGIL